MIAWNLLLLVIPFFLCGNLIKLWQKSKFSKCRQKLAAVCLYFVWLLFIPNSAYIITDIRHLLNFCPLNQYKICIENAWMIMFFFSYSVIGWVAFVYLINQMKILVNEIWGKLAVKIYIWLIAPIVSLGVLLGLINRWNSWEALIYPIAIAKDALKYFTDFVYFKNWIIFTIFLYILYFTGNYLFLPYKYQLNKKD
ncbi:MAG: DUF1361 domain-containing protein [Patescibacteria group bacterium]|nr:DUF1361 domain-containing protein [Patescibacteria group bacterium]